jgi:hypothetical protein
MLCSDHVHGQLACVARRKQRFAMLTRSFPSYVSRVRFPLPAPFSLSMVGAAQGQPVLGLLLLEWRDQELPRRPVGCGRDEEPVERHQQHLPGQAGDQHVVRRDAPLDRQRVRARQGRRVDVAAQEKVVFGFDRNRRARSRASPALRPGDSGPQATWECPQQLPCRYSCSFWARRNIVYDLKLYRPRASKS